MNERIVDLYEQASSFASEEESPIKSYKDRVLLKFAELIVRECADIAIDNGCGDFVDINQKLFEHFGVEQCCGEKL